jgi:hypothetical protein
MRQAIALLCVLCSSTVPAHDLRREAAAKPGTSPWKWLERAVPSARAAMQPIVVEGEWRVIRADGLPDHTTGAFPNRENPNRISAQQYEYRIPAKPLLVGTPTWIHLGQFGIALNGVPFDAGAAEFWKDDWKTGWQYEPMSGAIPLGLDQNNAHVQPSGAYHYHGMPHALLERLSYRGKPALIGYAADGFPIYGPFGHADPKIASSPIAKLRSSYRLKAGSRSGGPGGAHDGKFVQDYEWVAGHGELDECNGRIAVTPEHPEGTYQYVITDGFPFVPRCYKGTPGASFQRAPSGADGVTKGPKPKPKPPPKG